MKKLFTFALMVISIAISCSKFDDSEIWEKLNDHETRIAYLEEVCKNMNTNIVNLQTIVTALEANDYIISASPLVTGDGYTFLFKSGKSIVIYNGKDGQDGTNGVDGVTPVISVKQDTDGYYYWTVNGEWLVVDGKKVKASATDGENGDNGANGVDGITPKFKIEEDYWYVSYDNGKSWEKLGKATGSNGLNGEDGDSLFNKVYIEDGYVCFELNDQIKTIIRIPLMKEGTLTVSLEKEGTLAKAISSEEVRTTTSLILKGRVNLEDLRTIQIMTSLQTLDLSGIDFVPNESGYPSFKLNPYQDTLINRSISEVILPKFSELIGTDFSYCIALRSVTVTSDYSLLYSLDDMGIPSMITLCPLLNELAYSEGVTVIQENSYGKSLQLDRITYPSTLKYIPAKLSCFAEETTETTSSGTKRYTYSYFTVPCGHLVCKAVVPPVLDLTNAHVTWNYDSAKKWYYYVSSGTRYYYYKVEVPSNTVLYVPEESIESYRTAPIWENFTNILPLESLEN